MEKSTIIDRYEIIDTLHADEYQSTFVCNLMNTDDNRDYIVNEFRDPEIIMAVRDSFVFNKKVIKLLEAFQYDDKFYTVFPPIIGTPLDQYISKHNLTIADKMTFTDMALKKFVEISSLDYVIQYALCDLKNISVQSRRFFHFNNIYDFNKDALEVEYVDIIKKIGYLMLCFFANKAYADIEKDKNSLPPAILPITVKCMSGGYNSLGKVYADFRNTLLYTTFVDPTSLDNQIRSKAKAVKARKRHKINVPRVIAWLLIFAFLIGGCTWFIKNRGTLVGPGKGFGIGKKGNPPIADFTISINKIYKDDEVKFIDKSVATNPGDEIETRLWTVEKDGIVIMNSDEDSITYSFNEIGEYRISLIAQDSRGLDSEPYTHSIIVLEKPEFPDDVDDDAIYDRK